VSSTGRWPYATARPQTRSQNNPAWRVAAIAGLTAILLLAPAGASAQNWPARLVRLIVPAAAGGSSDAAARLVANHFQAVLGRPFIIENKPGNGNALGAALVAQAEP